MCCCIPGLLEGLITRKHEIHGSAEEVPGGAEGTSDAAGSRGRRDPGSKTGAIKWIADQWGIHPEALRTSVRQAEIGGGVRPGTTTDEAKRIAEFEHENRELCRANEILKTSSAFFEAAELDRTLE
jgi:transposase